MIAAGLRADAGYDQWRDMARTLLACGVLPDHVAWRDPDERELISADSLPVLPDRVNFTVPRSFVEAARKVVLHRNNARFARLYRVLWRLQRQPLLMQDAADPDIVKLNAYAKAVRRDEHKMHAFVRFREVRTPEGARFVAWFEPQHYIVHESADFFVRRFAGMVWSIITPDASAHWDGETLSFGPGGQRGDVPSEDARDTDWRAYYESMFNPARLKVKAMTNEMPKHFWRNLPESESIQTLIRAAGSRTEDMVAAEPSTPRKRAGAAHAKIVSEDLPVRLEPIAEQTSAPTSPADLDRALKACRACPLWKNATQAVPGEGASVEPLLALVGEQPGDQEDLAGHPFVGPAGKVLDRALEEAGIDRREVFITNAVKHFKNEPRGKMRLHRRPDRGEVEACRWWVKHELALVKPKLIVALGATAVQSLSSRRGSLTDARGLTFETREGQRMRATMHPSYLLRLPDDHAREAAYVGFVADLRDAKRIAATSA